MLKFIFLLIYVLLIATFLLYSFRKLAIKCSHLETNYKGERIPVGSGSIIPFSLLFITPFIDNQHLTNDWMNYYLLSFALGIIGFVDDRYGNKEVKGIKGHLLHLIKDKKISTGLLKLILISFVGFLISIKLYEQWLTILLATITFSIWTNIINLLDVRPGRAIKGFLILAFITIFFHFSEIGFLEWLTILLALLLFIVDIMEWWMLGDTGSNIIGGIVGYWIILHSSQIELLLYLLIGSLLTIYAEKKSFSRWIDSHPIIKKIDHWGRKITD